MNRKSVKTLKDIADICNVSTSTVSRVLNNEPGISGRTREEILAAVEKYNFFLRKRKKQKTRVLMNLVIVIPEQSEMALNPFYDINELLNAINSVFNTTRKAIQVQTFSEFRAMIRSDDYHTDGIIFAFGSIEEEDREILTTMEIPCIFLNRSPESYNYVSCNHIKGMMRLYGHLLYNGHRRIGYLGYTDHPVNYERRIGFEISCSGNSGPEKGPVMNVDSIDSITEGTAEYFIKEGCDAVMCFNDNFAIRLINQFREKAVRIPDDISITGFDNTPMRKLFKPLITTISLSTYEMGFLAARWLYDNIVNKSLRRLHCEIDGELIAGETVRQRKEQQ